MVEATDDNDLVKRLHLKLSDSPYLHDKKRVKNCIENKQVDKNDCRVP